MADPDIPLDSVYSFPVVPMMAPTAPAAPPAAIMMQQASLLHHGGDDVDAAALQALAEQGYTKGLAQALSKNKRAFALSIWIVDNSGSMQTRDGHRIVEGRSGNSAGTFKFVECSRWSEMQQTVDYHAQMAALMRAPTIFRLLNDPGRVVGPQVFSIAADHEGSNIDHDLSVAVSTMQNSQPGGVTPLTQHIEAIRQTVSAMQPQLRQSGTKVAVVLATDGLPTDEQGYSNQTVKQQFIHALRSLEGLPVWIVVRLCTDEEDVVRYWNDLDAQLELSLEVLDDFVSEAQEVHKANPWLTYGLPLHRMREMGFHDSIFDLIDERKLSRDEVRHFVRILFGSYEAPDPEADWKGFCAAVAQLVAKEKKQYNPVHKRVEPWIDMNRFKREYGHGGLFGHW